jgi:16S rRNA (adenine1518-N6/adenine1519-N6)-dimethyltransferase
MLNNFDLTHLPTIKALLKTHNLWAKKFLGQNFLVNDQSLEKIVEAANIAPEDYVIEVGPGLGVLTQELAQRAQKVTSVELDNYLFPLLDETLAPYDNIEIIHQDALQFTPPASPYKVVANIPYNITSPIINHFLQAENRPKSLTLLVQKEVAQKAVLIEPKMSVLSMQIALFGKATSPAKVPNDHFYPAPKVDSAVLHIEVHPKNSPQYFATDEALQILQLAHRAFRQGRKKLSNTLPDLLKKLEKLQLSEKRPQHLSIDEWKKLTEADIQVAA